MDCVNNHSLLWCEERLTQNLQAVRERVAGREVCNKRLTTTGGVALH